jgi:hypothetical protein
MVAGNRMRVWRLPNSQKYLEYDKPEYVRSQRFLIYREPKYAYGSTSYEWLINGQDSAITNPLSKLEVYDYAWGILSSE